MNNPKRHSDPIQPRTTKDKKKKTYGPLSNENVRPAKSQEM